VSDATDLSPAQPSLGSASVLPEIGLNEFINSTLLEIQLGVQTAIEEMHKREIYHGRINPGFEGKDGRIYWKDEDYRQRVEFDVAVTVSNKTEVSGKAGVRIWVVEGGGGVSKMAEHSTVNRVKFTVPLLLPVSPLKWDMYAPPDNDKACPD